MGLRGSEVQILSPRPTYDVDDDLEPAALRRHPATALLIPAVCALFAACSDSNMPYDEFRYRHFEHSLSAAKALADDGNPAASNLVGIRYYLGVGVMRDFTEASRWFEHSARLGDANAQRNLATLYLRGLGVKQDNFLAYAWFTEAAERGNQRARDYLALMSDRLTPNQMVRARHALDGEIGQRGAD